MWLCSQPLLPPPTPTMGTAESCRPPGRLGGPSSPGPWSSLPARECGSPRSSPSPRRAGGSSPAVGRNRPECEHYQGQRRRTTFHRRYARPFHRPEWAIRRTASRVGGEAARAEVRGSLEPAGGVPPKKPEDGHQAALCPPEPALPRGQR